MSKISIITDTDSSLPPELAAQHGIYLVPITIHVRLDETYETGVNINDKTLFEKIDAIGKLPTTAAPSPAAFKAAYEKLSPQARTRSLHRRRQQDQPHLRISHHRLRGISGQIDHGVRL